MDTPLVLLKGRGIRIRPKLKSSNISSRKQLTNIQTLLALVLKFKSVAPQQLDMTWPKIPEGWSWETTAVVPLGTPDCTHPPLAVAAVAAKGLNSIRGRSASACTTWEQGQNLDFSWRLFTVVLYTYCFRQAPFECKIPQCLYKSFQVSLHCNDLQLVEGHLAESVKLDVPNSRDSSAMINSKHFQTHLQEWFHVFVSCAFQSDFFWWITSLTKPFSLRAFRRPSLFPPPAATIGNSKKCWPSKRHCASILVSVTHHWHAAHKHVKAPSRCQIIQKRTHKTKNAKDKWPKSVGL